MSKIAEDKSWNKFPKKIESAYTYPEPVEYDGNSIPRSYYKEGYSDASTEILERLKSINRSSMNHLYFIAEIDKIIKDFS